MIMGDRETEWGLVILCVGHSTHSVGTLHIQLWALYTFNYTHSSMHIEVYTLKDSEVLSVCLVQRA